MKNSVSADLVVSNLPSSTVWARTELGVVRERDVLTQDSREEPAGHRPHDDEEHDPHAERSPGVAAARSGKRLWADLHGHPHLPPGPSCMHGLPAFV